MRQLHRHLAGVSLISLFALGLFLTSPTNLDFWWYDASRHAMNGVFLRDFLMEGGLLHPVQFATTYYRQYPAINIGFYPPFLYMSTVPFLIVFGVSQAVSQAVVVLYACAGGVLAYLICQMRIGRLAATGTGLAVMALPVMALWSRQVQLDVPAITLLLATALALIRFLQSGRSRWLLAVAMFLGLAMLTRVQAGFAAPAVVLFTVFHPAPRRPPLRIWLAATLTFAIAALPAAGLAFYFSRVTQSLATSMPGMPKLGSVRNWIWYAEQLPAQMGLACVVIMLIGLGCAAVGSLRKSGSVELRVVTALALSSWLFFSLVSNKEPRFDLPTLPFLLIAAAFGLHTVASPVSRWIFPALAAWMTYAAIMLQKVPVVTGFKQAVEVAQQHTSAGGNVLISAHRDGSFIHGMRTIGCRRDIGVRRADKLLVEMHIMRQLGIMDRNLDEKQIADVLAQENIQVIVMQYGYLADQPTMRRLQHLLVSDPHFRLLAQVPMHGQVESDEHRLDIYQRSRASPAPQGLPSR